MMPEKHSPCTSGKAKGWRPTPNGALMTPEGKPWTVVSAPQVKEAKPNPAVKQMERSTDIDINRGGLV
jgi:hypothetical protein